MLYDTTLYFTILKNTSWYFLILHETSRDTILHNFTILHSTSQYFTILHITSQYFTLLHDNSQYFTLLHNSSQFITKFKDFSTLWVGNPKRHFLLSIVCLQSFPSSTPYHLLMTSSANWHTAKHQKMKGTKKNFKTSFVYSLSTQKTERK